MLFLAWNVGQMLQELEAKWNIVLHCVNVTHPLLYQLPIAPQLGSWTSTKLARSHFLQQLSVSLWTNNARMTLKHWALWGGDSDFPTLHQLL